MRFKEFASLSFSICMLGSLSATAQTNQIIKPPEVGSPREPVSTDGESELNSNTDKRRLKQEFQYFSTQRYDILSAQRIAARERERQIEELERRVGVILRAIDKLAR